MATALQDGKLKLNCSTSTTLSLFLLRYGANECGATFKFHTKPKSIIGNVLAELSEVSWQGRLADWLGPFLYHLRLFSQKHGARVFRGGRRGRGERKSTEPMADRVAPGAFQQLHHF